MDTTKRATRKALILIFIQGFIFNSAFSQITYLDLSGISNSASLSNVAIGSTGETFSANISTTGSPPDPIASSNGDFEFMVGALSDEQCLNITFSAGMHLYITDETTDAHVLNNRDSIIFNDTVYTLVDPDGNINMTKTGSSATFLASSNITSYTTWSVTFREKTSIQICGRRTSQSLTKNRHLPIRIGVNSTGPLPVELIEFRAVKSENDVNFIWSTASETDNDFFSLERSSNGTDWTLITTEPGNGTTLWETHYSTTDNSPIQGRSYYRLKQTDFDGTHSYSKSIIVDFDQHEIEKQSLTSFPNPCTGTVSFTSSEANFNNFQVMGSNGQHVTNKVSYLGNGTFDTSELLAGIYKFHFDGVSNTVLKK